MKVSGFTIVRNARKFNYPVLESINSILPICDEFIVSVGDSEDGTLEMIQSIGDPKIKIIESKWDMSEGRTVLSTQTNIALKKCEGDWAFYLQTDEVIHEKDLDYIRKSMERHLDDDVDALRFKWLHFYGSYYRYRIDHGWYQKQDRIIKNNGKIVSMGDAWGFERKDGRELRRKPLYRLLYHYGWVMPGDVMTQRRVNAEQIGFTELKDGEREDDYSYGDLSRFPAYFGSHPVVMGDRIKSHELSQNDLKEINKKFWWHPMKMLRLRHKTSRRVKNRIT